MKTKQYLNPARNKDESFEAYKVRRCSANYYVKDKLAGTLVWNSIKCSVVGDRVNCVGNTYRKAANG